MVVVRTKVGKGKAEDRMVHEVCPSSEPVTQVGGPAVLCLLRSCVVDSRPVVHIQASATAAIARIFVVDFVKNS